MRPEQIAYAKGYRSTAAGDIIGPKGFALARQVHRSDGRLRFKIRIETKMIGVATHRFVAYELYRESMYEQGIEVRHLDGNCQNNAWVNIAIGTKSENMMDRTPGERLRVARIAASHKHRLTNEQVLQLVADRIAGADYKTLCAKYGLCKSLVSYICNGRTYGHITGIQT